MKEVRESQNKAEFFFSQILKKEYQAMAVRNNEHHLGSGEMAAAHLADGRNWFAFASDQLRKKKTLDMLLLGAGADIAAVTGGVDRDNRQNPQLTSLIAQKACRIVAHTQYDTLAPFARQHGVTDFRTGHFYDVLRALHNEGKQFDIIESNWALISTQLAPLMIPLIDSLLQKDGAAFLSGVMGVTGVSGMLIYPSGTRLPKKLDLHTIRQTQSLASSQCGGIPWSLEVRSSHDAEQGAWRKGELDRQRLLSLENYLPIANTVWGTPSLQAIYSSRNR